MSQKHYHIIKNNIKKQQQTAKNRFRNKQLSKIDKNCGSLTNTKPDHGYQNRNVVLKL